MTSAKIGTLYPVRSGHSWYCHALVGGHRKPGRFGRGTCGQHAVYVFEGVVKRPVAYCAVHGRARFPMEAGAIDTGAPSAEVMA